MLSVIYAELYSVLESTRGLVNCTDPKGHVAREKWAEEKWAEEKWAEEKWAAGLEPSTSGSVASLLPLC